MLIYQGEFIMKKRLRGFFFQSYFSFVNVGCLNYLSPASSFLAFSFFSCLSVSPSDDRIIDII